MDGLVFQEYNREIELLRHPTPHFRLLTLTSDIFEVWADYLREGYLVTSDEYRNDAAIETRINSLFKPPHVNLVYEIGDSSGVAIFRNIILGFKCAVEYMLWDDTMINKTIFRESYSLLTLVKRTLYLKRICAETALPRVVKLALKLGFKREGVKRCDFLWNGKLYDVTVLGMACPYIPNGGKNE